MSEKFIFKKPNFGSPPSGYIAGLGRGATGFITRSDLGPARVPQNSQSKQEPTQQNDEGVFVDSKYDNWEGYKAPLFSKNQMDDQDKQAEQAYDYCERKMDERKEKARAEKNKTDIQQIKKDNAPINENFKDLKRELAKISYQQWQNIPESYDSSIKKKNRQKYTPVPDSLVINFLNNNSNKTAVDPQTQTNQDYRDAKQILLKSKLDNAEQKIQRQNLDKIGYITQLNTSKLGSDILGDVPKARLLLKSAMQSNPKNPDIWISAARVQELDGKINQARQILKKATSFCPLTEDIWIQLSRIQKFQNSKKTLIQGLKHLPNSQKMWIYASKLQNDKQLKSKILRKGLQNNPQSVKLWKQLIQLQNLAEAKTLLYKAVQFLPHQIDLWLALSKIQPYENAKLVLNKARKSNPLSLQIWINAAKLQEAEFIKNNSQNLSDKNLKCKDKIIDKIQNILMKARQILKKNGRNVNRDEWLDQALYCQKSENFITCQAIIKISVVYGLSEDQIVNTILKDAKIFQEQRESIQTVRFIYKHGILNLKNKILLQKFILFQERSQNKIKQEKKQQNLIFDSNQHKHLFQVLELSTKLFPQDTKFWCLIIQKYINQGKLNLAQDIIVKAEQTIQDKQTLQPIKLLKIKVLIADKKLIQAKCELQIMSESYPKGKSRIQLIKLLYMLKNYQKAWESCEKYFKQIHSEEIWELAFKILDKLGKNQQAKNILQAATTQLPNSILLWKLLIQTELSTNHLGKARSTLDKAILKNPKSEELYIFGVQIQLQFRSNKQMKQVNYFLSKALKACPKNPQLWGISVQIQPISTRKKRASVALQNCGVTSSILNSSIAKIFWKQNKIDKAKKWMNSSLELDKTNGDIWVLYIFFLEQKYPLEAKLIYSQFLQAQITCGRKWRKYTQNLFQNQTKQKIFQSIKKEYQRQINRIN